MRFFFWRTPLGWIQLRHDWARLLISMLGVAVADVLIFMQLGIVETNYAAATTLHRHLRCQLVLFHSKGVEIGNLFTFPRRRLYQALENPAVSGAEPLYIGVLGWKHPETGHQDQLLALGFEPDCSGLDLPGISAFPLHLPDHVVLDGLGRGDYRSVKQRLAEGQSVSVEVARHTLRIQGFVNIGTSFMRSGHLLASVTTFLRLYPVRQPGQVSLGLLRLRPGADSDTVARQLRAQLPDDVKVLTYEQFIQFELDHLNKEAPMTLVFGLMTAVAFVVGAAIIYQILSTDVNDHLAEYATFKAMGFRDSFLLVIVIEEALILAVAGFVPAVLTTLGLYAVIRSSAQLPLFMTATRMTLVFGLTLVMGFLSGALACRKLRQADPADIF